MSLPTTSRSDNTVDARSEAPRTQGETRPSQADAGAVVNTSSSPGYIESSRVTAAVGSANNNPPPPPQQQQPPPIARPVFLSADNISTVNRGDINPRLLHQTHLVVHPTELNTSVTGPGHRHVTPGLTRNQDSVSSVSSASVRSAPTGARSDRQDINSQHFTGLRRVPIDFRLTLDDYPDLVSAMAALEANIPGRGLESSPEYELLDPEPESGVDKSLPHAQPITRRRSSEEARPHAVSVSRKENSLLDLRKVREQYLRVARWEGTSDPDVIFKILEFYPELEHVIMSPTLPPNHREYCPHDMRMVSPDSADVMNYCVVGRESVIRYIKGKHPKQMTAKRWAFEQSTHIKLRKIPFFKNFRIMKSFNALGHHVDMSNFGRNRRRLRSNMLSCEPLLSDMLLLVRTMCLDMAQLSLIQVDGELTYTISEFMEDQEHFTREVTSKLERCNALLVHLTARTCWDDVISAGLAVEREGRRVSAPKRISEMRKLQRLRQSAGPLVGRTRLQDDVSIGTWLSSDDPENNFEFESRKNERCVKLARFIYLIDLMLQDTIHQIFIKSLKRTSDYLSMQLATFPSDEKIVQIVKDYLGDVQVPEPGMMWDEDMGPDNGGGGGAGGWDNPGKGTHGWKGGGGGRGGSGGGSSSDGGGGGSSGGGGRTTGRWAGEGGSPTFGGAGRADRVDPRLTRSMNDEGNNQVFESADGLGGLGTVQINLNNEPILPSLPGSSSPSPRSSLQPDQQQQQPRHNPTLHPSTRASLPLPSPQSTDHPSAASLNSAHSYILPENEAVFPRIQVGVAESTLATVATTAVATPNTLASSLSTSTVSRDVLYHHPGEESTSQLDITTDTIGASLTSTTTTTTSTTSSGSEGEELDYYGDDDGANLMGGDHSHLAFMERALLDMFMQQGEDDGSDTPRTLVGDDRRVLALPPPQGVEEAGDTAPEDFLLDLEAEETEEPTLVEMFEGFTDVTEPGTPTSAMTSALTKAPGAETTASPGENTVEQASSATLTITSDETPTSEDVSLTSLKDEADRSERRGSIILCNMKPSTVAGHTKPIPWPAGVARSLTKNILSPVTEVKHENNTNLEVKSPKLHDQKAAVRRSLDKDGRLKREVVRLTRPELSRNSSRAPDDSLDDDTCENACMAPVCPLPGEELFKDLRLSGIFYSLRDSVMESSVDAARENQDDDVLEFPILDGNAWDRGNVERYMNVRSAPGTSVDNDAGGMATPVSQPGNSQDHNRNSGGSAFLGTLKCNGLGVVLKQLSPAPTNQTYENRHKVNAVYCDLGSYIAQQNTCQHRAGSTFFNMLRLTKIETVCYTKANHDSHTPQCDIHNTHPAEDEFLFSPTMWDMAQNINESNDHSKKRASAQRASTGKVVTPAPAISVTSIDGNQESDTEAVTEPADNSNLAGKFQEVIRRDSSGVKIHTSFPKIDEIILGDEDTDEEFAGYPLNRTAIFGSAAPGVRKDGGRRKKGGGNGATKAETSGAVNLSVTPISGSAAGCSRSSPTHLLTQNGPGPNTDAANARKLQYTSPATSQPGSPHMEREVCTSMKHPPGIPHLPPPETLETLVRLRQMEMDRRSASTSGNTPNMPYQQLRSIQGSANSMSPGNPSREFLTSDISLLTDVSAMSVNRMLDFTDSDVFDEEGSHAARDSGQYESALDECGSYNAMDHLLRWLNENEARDSVTSVSDMEAATHNEQNENGHNNFSSSGVLLNTDTAAISKTINCVTSNVLRNTVLMIKTAKDTSPLVDLPGKTVPSHNVQQNENGHNDFSNVSYKGKTIPSYDLQHFSCTFFNWNVLNKRQRKQCPRAVAVCLHVPEIKITAKHPGNTSQVYEQTLVSDYKASSPIRHRIESKEDTKMPDTPGSATHFSCSSKDAVALPLGRTVSAVQSLALDSGANASSSGANASGRCSDAPGSDSDASGSGSDAQESRTSREDAVDGGTMEMSDVDGNGMAPSSRRGGGSGAGGSGGGGSSGGNSGGGGSGGGSPGGNSGGWSWKMKKAELKPMFHAALSLNGDHVMFSPDVYDVTATAFNMIHDMEEHALRLNTLTSNPVFLPFTRPTVAGQTAVDSQPKGPKLESVLRRDYMLTNIKNSIYQCVDDMFRSTGIYVREMQRVYDRVFRDVGAAPDRERDVIFYCHQLTRHDAQMKISERLPDSQKLGMFLIDITPYKESVQTCYQSSLRHTHMLMNSDISLKVGVFLERIDHLQNVLDGRPSTTDLLFRRLTVMDSLESRLESIMTGLAGEIAALYDVVDRFGVPHIPAARQSFESSHYLVSSVKQAWEESLKGRDQVVADIERLLERDVAWLNSQVKKALRPLVERSLFLDGKSDPEYIKTALTETEEVVRSHVTKANFVREVQQYLKLPENQFKELFQVASRYVNTRNLWLLMADWDAKLHSWKHQSFATLDIQKINSYTFRYMEACDKLERVLPKNSVVTVFGEKVDVMLRWLNFIIEFRGQVIKPRHWRQIEEALGVEFGDELPLTLASLMSVNAVEKQKILHAILNKARAESNIQTEYDEVTRQCRELAIPTQQRPKVLVEGEETVQVFLMLDTFEVEESLNYCLMELERIGLSPHAGFLNTALDEFVHKILEALENLVQWAEMQMKLSRLRRLVLRHSDVAEALPDEITKYKNIYTAYSAFIESVALDPSVLKWCASTELHDLLQQHGDEIVRIYRALKRNIDSRPGLDQGNRDFGTWVVM